MDERDDWTLTDAVHHQQGRGDPFAAAVRSTRMPMIITNPEIRDNPIIFANDAFQKLTGYDRAELMGRNCRLLQGPETDPAAIARIRAAVAAGTDISIDVQNYRKDGTTFWNALYISPVRDDDGRIRFFFSSQMDVTDRVRAQERILRERARAEDEARRRAAELRSSIDAQRLLQHEVDHRVKNNMAMIGSILRLQLREVHDPATAELLRSMMARIDALATVHRHLYQSDDVSRFDIGAYAVALASDLVQGLPGAGIRILADLDRAEVPSGQASALGLIVNAILSGMIGVEATGPAGPDPVASLTIAATTSDSKVTLSLRSGLRMDAHGAPAAAPRHPTGLNAQIIARLARQSGATVSWSGSNPGDTIVNVEIGREIP